MLSNAARYRESVTVPAAVRFPVELVPPDGFDPERLETWPRVAGRLEYLEGKLLFRPPCADLQQDTVTDVVIVLGAWVRRHPGLVLGTNEAGMRLAGATRAADAAVWRRADLGAYTGRLRRVAPLLAVEVAGQDEDETVLRGKARWYLVLPTERAVVVLTATSTTRHAAGEKVSPRTELLPDLEPEVAELFRPDHALTTGAPQTCFSALCPTETGRPWRRRRSSRQPRKSGSKRGGGSICRTRTSRWRASSG